MKKYFILILLVMAIPSLLVAQNPMPILVNVYPALDTHSISPFIYGSNGQSDDRDENITARRIGGNRMTGYNWETNASNAGTDYLNQSDDYMAYISGITGADAKKPGIVITAFHDTSLAMNCYSLVTLQAAGYVAADVNGPVSQAETAPSKRWNQVYFAKGSPFSLTPDLTDNKVYTDEEVNFLVNKYGRTKVPRGIRGYEIDNEPGLWPSTHPRIHPNKPSIAEYIATSTALSKAVKAVDPNAEIFGGVMYGFNEYQTFQDAPDWNSYKSYGTYINAYLSNMKDSSTKAGKRLLDVLDLHWYPEAQGLDNNGKLTRITQSQVADSGVLIARDQAPRTLWDPNYKENSWIAQYFSPVALLPWLKASIDKYYPGTKLAFTEINYGGDSSISGAVAMTDVLGLFGKYDVYFSSYWGPLVSFVSGAYKIYRNYDGANSTFGDIYCKATVNDSSVASVYSSLDSHDSTKLHVIVINKGLGERPDLVLKINSDKVYASFLLFGINPDNPNIYSWGIPTHITGNRVLIEAGPQSIYHFIFSLTDNSSVAEDQNHASQELHCTFSDGRTNIHYNASHQASIQIIDIQGKTVKKYDGLEGIGTIEWQGTSGMYEVLMNDGAHVETQKILNIR